MKRVKYSIMAFFLIGFLVGGCQTTQSQGKGGGGKGTGTDGKAEIHRAMELNKKASALFKQGRYFDAAVPAEEARRILEQNLGAEHPRNAGVMSNLGRIYLSQGRKAEAEELFLKALAIQEKAYGPEDSRVSNTLNHLSNLYLGLGDLSRAEKLFQRTLAAREKTLGPDHPAVAKVLNDMGYFYLVMGNREKAEEVLKRALEIDKKTAGPDSLKVANDLLELARLNSARRRNDKAEELYVKALAIKEKLLGPEHPRVAEILTNLGQHYRKTRKFDQSEQCLGRALSIREKSLGPEHAYTGRVLFEIARLKLDRGQIDQALSVMERAVAVWEKSLGSDHPRVGSALNDLSLIQAMLGRYQEAGRSGRRSQDISGDVIDQVMGFTSEEEKLQFLATKQKQLTIYLNLIAQHLSRDPASVRDGLDVWLRRKGIILEAQRKFQEALIYSDNPEAMAAFQELGRLRASLARLAFSGGRSAEVASEASPEDDSAVVISDDALDEAELRARINEQEAKLSRLSQSYATNLKKGQADTSSVAAALPAGSVHLDFVRLRWFNFAPLSDQKRWQEDHYLVFLLPSGGGNQVHLYDLGVAGPIDAAVTELKNSITNLNDLKGEKSRIAARNLYDLVFKPLVGDLGKARNIFISPDGNLCLIPFEVLAGPGDHFLVEDYTFNYVSAGRDLLGFTGDKTGNGSILLLGDPAFDLSVSEKQESLTRLGLTRKASPQGVPSASGLTGLSFGPLPGTRVEVEEIGAIFSKEKVDLRMGDQALEEVLRQTASPRILHLATHGFFLSDVELESLTGSSVLGDDTFSVGVDPDMKPARYYNPLLRSGLALAGANRAAAADGDEDGIFTAEEVLSLNLRGTELVVLSACQTGLGKIRSGEGVYGLRRAFTQAGARGLVMSMWPVPDQETQELMVQFYQNLESGGMNRAEALRQSALKEMRIVQERYGSANPFFWGAFVFLGQP